jgi:hypothetical protein
VKLSRLKRFFISAAIFLVVVAMVTAVYLAKPLSPPKISIEFQSFKPDKARVFHLKPDTNDNNQVFFDCVRREDWWFRAFPSFQNFLTEQTNAFCTLYLTNHGPTRIWWISLDCQVEARTPSGWVTNVFSHFTTTPWSVGSSTKDAFNVYVPMDAIEWRVTGQYEYFKRHCPSLEFIGWLSDDLDIKRKHPSGFIVYPLVPICWALGLAPRPKEEFSKIDSQIFTNKPLVAFQAANSTPH